MKNWIYILCICFIGLACKKNKPATCPEPELDCSLIRCALIQYSFDFRIVDKTTGADLVFGATPKYTTAQIKLYRDANKQNEVTLAVDSAAKLFTTFQSSPQMYLEVAGLNTYKLDVEYKVVDCCSNRVKLLLLDGQSICTCCDDGIQLKVN